MSKAVPWSTDVRTTGRPDRSTSAAAADDEFKLVIENHKFEPAEITVPAGVYEVRIQREYSPEAIRPVAD